MSRSDDTGERILTEWEQREHDEANVMLDAIDTFKAELTGFVRGFIKKHGLPIAEQEIQDNFAGWVDDIYGDLMTDARYKLMEVGGYRKDSNPKALPSTQKLTRDCFRPVACNPASRGDL